MPATGPLAVRLAGFLISNEETGLNWEDRAEDLHFEGAEAGSPPDYGVGPHLALVGAVVSLARRDLSRPVYSEEAEAFLLGRPHRGVPVGLDVDLLADCLGYGGSWLA